MNGDSTAIETSGSARSSLPPDFSPALTHVGLNGREAPVESGFEWMLPLVRVLPDPAICQAKAAGFGDYADCLVERPFHCPHALSLGFGFLCQHPQRIEIILRTVGHA